jgi:D-alanyl-D-alanine carboxypeptidase/D-alanyl-D-alanine-endopeptidase (penicillin-binding protein 4)
MSQRVARVLAAGTLLAVAARGQSPSERPSPPLAGRVDAILKAPGYEHGRWGLLVVDAKDGSVVLERRADELYRPASVTKLYSTAAALVTLGPDFRFTTAVHRRGEVDRDGHLKGDLILVASGDPALGGRTGADGTLLFRDHDHSYAGGNLKGELVDANPLAGLEALAREVAGAGIKSVSGDVIVDDRLFAPEPSTGSGASRVTPIIVNDNLVDLVVAPAETPGAPATVRTVPATSYLAIDARVETGPKDATPALRVARVGPRSVSVRGVLPVGHRPVVKITEMDDPASFARGAFLECLRRAGVEAAASPLGENRPADLPGRDAVAALPRVAQYTSPPFREYVKVVLKVSQNLHASLLPILLAARGGPDATLAAGLRRQGEVLAALGVSPAAISFGGGAGGSGSDLVSPRATVALLRAMAARPEFPAYEAALPVLGRDGTLAESVGPDSPARGHVRAKTGTYWVDNALNGKAVMTSKALAGYMETASGRRLVFCLFVNDVPLDLPADDVSAGTEAAGKLLGRLCEALYDDASTARPTALDAGAAGR